MFERIIVALDGSPSSEAALPAAEELAHRLGSSLVLLHVLEARPPRLVHGERHIADRSEAEAYLARLSERISASGLRVMTHVHSGSDRGVAAEVAAHEGEFGNDLAVMAAHGRRGISDALAGSLPLKVAASGGAGVLVVPRPGERGRFPPSRLLVPLDGKAEHEAALPAVLTLARTFGADILLVAALPRHGSEGGGASSSLALLAPATSGASLEYAVEGAGRYLAEKAAAIAKELGNAGRVETAVLRGRPAKAILSAADAGDMIILSTHRKLGLDASLDGCVAFGVARGWRGYLLIEPVTGEEAASR
jgi:nucleotide-binding universal stress UspA family protein